jgi:hypothetical protein
METVEGNLTSTSIHTRHSTITAVESSLDQSTFLAISVPGRDLLGVSRCFISLAFSCLEFSCGHLSDFWPWLLGYGSYPHGLDSDEIGGLQIAALGGDDVCLSLVVMVD